MPDADRSHAEAVVFDLLRPVDVVPIGARMPADPSAAAIARRTGYASAFVAAFRREVGVPPGSYFATTGAASRSAR